MTEQGELQLEDMMPEMDILRKYGLLTKSEIRCLF